ncbi:hypothetical protein B0J14DRAFT_212168 [Halenospora varia]|nr:hypothetical protein B0J14DRAFT_212168 [Halenospora varia]
MSNSTTIHLPTSASSVFPESFYIISITIFAILLLPTFYIWRCHGRPGILPYSNVYAICAVHIAGGALSIAAVNNSGLEIGATVLNSMAISPLLLAALGVLHEARKARNLTPNNTREWRMVAGYHALVLVAIILFIIGIVDVMNGKSTAQKSGLIKGGLVMLVISYFILMVWALSSIKTPGRPAASTFQEGTKLLYAAVLAMPFIGVRLIYGILSFLLTDPHFSRSLVAKVTLSLIPEVLATALFVVAGFATKDMWKGLKAPKNVEAGYSFEMRA